MTRFPHFRSLFSFGLSVLLAGVGAAHTVLAQEGPVPTQILVSLDAKASVPPAGASAFVVNVNDKKQPLSSLAPMSPANTQLAFLIDDGLRESVGRELSTMRAFVQGLPDGMEVLIGYMQNGRVVEAQPFTTDHAAAAAALRLPEGIPGGSASPYFCISDFVKRWQSAEGAPAASQGGLGSSTIVRGPVPTAPHKARIILAVTNGVDPYNGSTSPMNQDSPYVEAAISDAQRAGVSVYSIYYTDAGIRGFSASLSGQSYLQQLSEATGGSNYFEGTGNPVSMQPFLKMFTQTLAKTYIATFDAPMGRNPDRDMVRIKLTATPKTKLHIPAEVLPGNSE